ncbi:unnamed protein product [Closterium sp. NIES-54]
MFTPALILFPPTHILLPPTPIQSGDDNVAINDGCHNMLIENLVCINGHGVSIGSLGEDQDTGCVSDVLVRNVSFTGSNNALRIKTYQGGKGLVSNVTYRDIRVTDVTWPIIIDQVCVVMLCGAPSTHESYLPGRHGACVECDVSDKDIRVTDVTWPIINQVCVVMLCGAPSTHEYAL